jgi:RNA polymerase sigma factor (sigma-70 family)
MLMVMSTSKHSCHATPAVDDDVADGLSPAALDILVANHQRFLAFLERRVGRREVAEEILQDAFVRGLSLGAGAALRDDESALAWFYRLLRNAIVDRARRADVERRGLARAAAEPTDVPDQELADVVCACITAIVETLKPDYARAIRRVELEGLGVRAFAAEERITDGNAAVRLHRARQALRRRLEESCGTCATHGCYACECTTAEHAS